jgi:hypothetical protein
MKKKIKKLKVINFEDKLIDKKYSDEYEYD